jgi:hypothetical protein
LIGDGPMMASSTLHLSFGDREHNLNAAQQDPGTAKSFESQHGSHTSLDRPMVLLDKVVEIFGLEDPDGRFTIIIDGFECGQIGAAFVNGHRIWYAILDDRFLKITSGCSPVPMGA